MHRWTCSLEVVLWNEHSPGLYGFDRPKQFLGFCGHVCLSLICQESNIQISEDISLRDNEISLNGNDISLSGNDMPSARATTFAAAMISRAHKARRNFPIIGTIKVPKYHAIFRFKRMSFNSNSPKNREICKIPCTVEALVSNHHLKKWS